MPHPHVELIGDEFKKGRRKQAIIRFVQLLGGIEKQYLKKGSISNTTFQRIQRFLATFVNTQQTDDTYRLPTRNEFYTAFPELKVRRQRMRMVQKNGRIPKNNKFRLRFSR